MPADLSTSYLGLELRNPLVLSACPLSEKLDHLKRFVDAGVAAAVFPSLFEEQLEAEAEEVLEMERFGSDSFPEALDYFPPFDDYNLGPDAYLDRIAQAKPAVGVPIIGSLNGSSPGGWTRYARLIQDAGADAVELNITFVAADVERSAAEVEDRVVGLVADVAGSVSVPVAVKLAPYFSSLGHLAQRIERAGARGLVLFNRILHSDIDLERLRFTPDLELSSPYECRLTLMWMALLRDRVGLSLGATGGVASAADATKLLMTGADAVLCASSFYRGGAAFARTMTADLAAWLDEHEYESVRQMIGSMSRENADDADQLERVNYMRAITSYSGDPI